MAATRAEGFVSRKPRGKSVRRKACSPTFRPASACSRPSSLGVKKTKNGPLFPSYKQTNRRQDQPGPLACPRCVHTHSFIIIQASHSSPKPIWQPPSPRISLSTVSDTRDQPRPEKYLTENSRKKQLMSFTLHTVLGSVTKTRTIPHCPLARCLHAARSPRPSVAEQPALHLVIRLIRAGGGEGRWQQCSCSSHPYFT